MCRFMCLHACTRLSDRLCPLMRVRISQNVSPLMRAGASAGFDATHEATSTLALDPAPGFDTQSGADGFTMPLPSAGSESTMYGSPVPPSGAAGMTFGGAEPVAMVGMPLSAPATGLVDFGADMFPPLPEDMTPTGTADVVMTLPLSTAGLPAVGLPALPGQS